MKEINQRKIFKFFLNKKIENFFGVPDSTMKYFIEEGIKNNNVIITTREEEAIGMAVGTSLSGNISLVFMQNAGFGNSLSTITSLVQLYKIPVIFLIGWRGYIKNDAPEHFKFGKIQPRILKALGLKSKILTDTNWKNACLWALEQTSKQNSCALIIRRTWSD